MKFFNDRLRLWPEKAVCRGAPHLMYEDVWPVDPVTAEQAKEPNEEALAVARSHCDACPVRGQCYSEAADMERGAAIINRYGVRAGMTPAQRFSAEKRNAIRCPVCKSPLDPTQVRNGIVRCPENPKHINRKLAPIPDEGDQWNKRHTLLARRVVTWLVEDVKVGQRVPRATTLAKKWKVRVNDMLRVYEALIADGTLSVTKDGNIVRRGNPGTSANWYPRFLSEAA